MIESEFSGKLMVANVDLRVTVKGDSRGRMPPSIFSSQFEEGLGASLERDIEMYISSIARSDILDSRMGRYESPSFSLPLVSSRLQYPHLSRVYLLTT